MPTKASGYLACDSAGVFVARQRQELLYIYTERYVINLSSISRHTTVRPRAKRPRHEATTHGYLAPRLEMFRNMAPILLCYGSRMFIIVFTKPVIDCAMSLLKPVHISAPFFKLKITFNIVLSSALTSSMRRFSSRVADQHFVNIFHFPNSLSHVYQYSGMR